MTLAAPLRHRADRRTAHPFVDSSVIATVDTFALFILIQGLAPASGAHFNPAVTTPWSAEADQGPTAAVYILASWPAPCSRRW